MLRDIGSNQCLLTYLVGGKVASEAVEIHAQHGCFLGRIALRQEREDDARQHVAAACRSHAGIARGVEEASAVGEGDGGMCAFQHDDEIVLHREFTLFFKTFERGRGFACDALKLLGMRCQDGLGGQESEPSGVVGEDVQGIGVHDERHLHLLNQEFQGTDGIVGLAQTWAHTNSGISVKMSKHRETGVGLVAINHGLGNGGLQGQLRYLGQMDAQQAHACAQTGFCT